MSLHHYFILAAVWIVICIGIGIFITGKGLSKQQHYTIGLKTMLISYALGICLLFIVITMS